MKQTHNKQISLLIQHNDIFLYFAPHRRNNIKCCFFLAVAFLAFCWLKFILKINKINVFLWLIKARAPLAVFRVLFASATFSSFPPSFLKHFASRKKELFIWRKKTIKNEFIALNRKIYSRSNFGRCPFHWRCQAAPWKFP